MSLSILKKLSVVATILLLAWVVYVYRLVPHNRMPFAKAIDQANEIIMAQGSKKIGFIKEAGHWKVGEGAAAPFYPVEEQPMATLISSLKNLELENEISDRADRAAEYEVTTASGITVSVLGPKETNISALGIFGKQAPDMAHLYFRYWDKSTVYLARGLIRGDLGRMDATPWRSRQLEDIAETKIQGIEIEGKGFKTTLVRVSTDAWTMNGQPVLDLSPVNSLVGVLAHLRADDFMDPAANPTLTPESLTYAHVKIQGTDSSSELRFGSPDPKSKRVPLSVSNYPGLIWASEATAKSILKKPSDFKK